MIRNSQHYLCDPMFINEVVDKLPISKRTEWMRASISILPFPTFRDLANWLNHEAQLYSLVILNSNTNSIFSSKINVMNVNMYIKRLLIQNNSSNNLW